jgi:hypothetical protein
MDEHSTLSRSSPQDSQTSLVTPSLPRPQAFVASCLSGKTFSAFGERGLARFSPMDTTKAMLNWNPIPDDLAICQERLDSPGQLHFSFTLGDPLDEETLSALEQLEQAEEEFVEEIIRRR